ncbi:hypothetical protein GUITHDRAFT_121582 [Guillardia theta CCMP2712]|uniref:Uncharacterized protein n=1 Tax=Guillardia theta (strain CCMP2712) TaxID=905079 RepID=L1I7L6_GUITC|nr:hypothetical protein GUITHDRAFT_121582 [Guillardia theta CCMP2712]EKX32256.1 hypothetical protein GUITHDRAFT_121582 [Guillardia theta CCMP2712]|eukprot:XP_005819236.1 hypothetical protein GUITHDRAFT_121582 [Guillardia theta CCMP2712]
MLWDVVRLPSDDAMSWCSSSTASEDAFDNYVPQALVDVDQSAPCQFASMECIRNSNFTVLADIGFFSPEGSSSPSEVSSPPLKGSSPHQGLSMMFEKIFPISTLQIMRRISNPPTSFASPSGGGQGRDALKGELYDEKGIISESVLYYIIHGSRSKEEADRGMVEKQGTRGDLEGAGLELGKEETKECGKGKAIRRNPSQQHDSVLEKSRIAQQQQQQQPKAVIPDVGARVNPVAIASCPLVEKPKDNSRSLPSHPRAAPRRCVGVASHIYISQPAHRPSIVPPLSLSRVQTEGC